MPSSARELKVYPCIPRLTECFGSGPSGGNVLVPARTLRRSRLKGRCRKAAPLGSTESPGRIAGTAKKYFRLLLVVLSKSLKNMLSLRASPQTGVAIRPLVPLGSHSGGAVTKWLRRQKAPSPPPAPLPKGEARPSSVSRLRETREPPSPWGKAFPHFSSALRILRTCI